MSRPIEIGLHSGGRLRVNAAAEIDASEIRPEDLAFGLAHVTRFGGQAGAYSVAEHTCRMHNWAKLEGQDKAVLKAILLHDAPECLGEGDTQRFVKRFFGHGGVAVFAQKLTLQLWDRFRPMDRGTWSYRVDCEDLVKHYDGLIGSIEARTFGFPHDPIPEWLVIPRCAEPVRQFQSAEYWTQEFMNLWEECS